MKCRAILFFVLALYLQQGQTIECYSCDSSKDSRCADPIDYSLQTVQCTPERFKTKGSFEFPLQGRVNHSHYTRFGVNNTLTEDVGCGKIETIDGDKLIVLRFCSPAMRDRNELCIILESMNTTIDCNICYTDGGNKVSAVLPSALLMVVATLAVLMATV